LLYSHDGIAQSITVNDTYTAQNLVNILTNNSTYYINTVFQETFQGLRKLWFFNSGTSSFPFKKNSFKHLGISKAVGPFDMTNIGGGSISWKEI
jgi:hypothetical protein